MSHVQAILFSRDKWNLTQARKWFKDEGFTLPKGKLVHVTKQKLRFRVLTPNYNKFYYRTKWFSKKDGIEAIIAFPK